MLTDDKKVPEVFTFILEKESLHSKGHYYILKPGWSSLSGFVLAASENLFLSGAR